MLKLRIPREIIVSFLAVVMLIFGVQGVSYGQGQIIITDQGGTRIIGGPPVELLDDLDIGYTRISTNTFRWRMTGTVRANRDVQNLRIKGEFNELLVGFDWIGDLRANYRTSYSIVGTISPPPSVTEATLATSYEIVPPPEPEVVDPSAPPIYWTDAGMDKIQRVNLDGSDIKDIVTQGVPGPFGIALDMAGGKMYWVDAGTEKIQRANLDGSDIENIVTRGLDNPNSIALDVAGGKMYWTDSGTEKIQRANLDGSDIENIVTQGLGIPAGIALDVAGGKMYWTDSGTEKIQRANLDGSDIEDIVTQGLRAPRGIALDVAGGKMYWTDEWTAKIQRANLDGSDLEDIVTQGVRGPRGIALDVVGGKMYWTDSGTEKIQRANLDGSDLEDIVARGVDFSNSIALGIPATQQPTPQPTPQPDLVVEATQAVPATVAPGEKFRLYTTLKNQGTAESAATTLRYYRSTDNVISTPDTQLRSVNRNPLAPNATLRRYLTVTAPTTPGTYYYGGCVDSVTNESDTANNCSTAVTLTVTAPAVVAEDVNDDGVVDVQDLVYVAQRYGQTGTNRADVNGDKVVNIDDLILVAAVLDADAAAAPSLNPNALEGLTVADVKVWLSQARQLNLTDPSVRRAFYS